MLVAREADVQFSDLCFIIYFLLTQHQHLTFIICVQPYIVAKYRSNTFSQKSKIKPMHELQNIKYQGCIDLNIELNTTTNG